MSHSKYLSATEQSLLDAASDGYWILAPDSSEIYCSENFIKLIGFEGKEWPKDSIEWLSFIHPEDQENFSNIRNEIYGQNYSGHNHKFRIRDKNGTYIWLQEKGKLIKSDADNSAIVVGTINVIEEPWHSKSKILSLLSNFQSGILLEDQNRRILYVNQQFCDLFNIPAPPEALLGMDCSNAAEQSKHLFSIPEDFVSGIKNRLQEKQQVFGERLQMADGRVLLRDFIPMWDDNRYSGHFWNYVDVTRFAIDEETEVQRIISFFLSSMYDKENLEALLWDVAQNCIGQLEFVDCVIYLLDEEKKELIQKAAYGPKANKGGNSIFHQINIRLGEGIVGKAAETGQPIIISDTTLHPEYIVDDAFRFSELAVPIVFNNKVLGVIDSEHPMKHFFSYKHVQILSAVANLCAIKIKQFVEYERQQQAIEKQRRFYEDILNNMPADIAVFNKRHQYLFINPKAIGDAELRQWMIGKWDEDYFRFRNKDIALALPRRKYFSKAVETKTLVSWEEEIKTPDGTSHFQLRNFYPVIEKDGAVRTVIGYGIDITERKLIEEKVKESQQAIQQIIESSPALILVHDMEGQIVMANPACYDLYGKQEGMLEGKNLDQLIEIKEIERAFSNYLKRIATKKTIKGICRVRNKEGRLKYLLFSSHLLSQQQSLQQVISFAIDITSRVLMETDLRIAIRTAEDASRAKEIFLANMSHEIRTPMNAIVGFSKLLGKTDLNYKQSHYLSAITESAQQLLKIVNDVLDLEKILSGKFQLESVLFSITEKVILTIDTFKYRAEEKGVALIADISLPKDLRVKGDPYRLTQILNNLISNAIKFTNKGNVKISARIEAESSNEVRIRFLVQDTGVGIPQSALSSIFDPYVQLGQGESKLEGTGLGLPICQKLVELQGGRMEVESQIGTGSAFSFSLSYEKSIEKASHAAPAKIKKQLLNGLRVLVAEDVKINQLLLYHTLLQWNCKVTIVNNGFEALQALNSAVFDVVLMDIQMPVMDGLTATKAIRMNHNPAIAGMPVIAITAHALKGDVDRFLQEGFDRCITKPLDEEVLLNALDQLLPHERVTSTKHDNTTLQNGKYAPPDKPNTFDPLLQMGSNSPEIQIELLQAWLESVVPAYSLLNNAWHSLDIPAMKQILHKMRPAIRSLRNEAAIHITEQLHNELETSPRKDIAIEACLENLEKFVSEWNLECKALIEKLNNRA